MEAVNYRGLARYFKPLVKERSGKESVNLDSIVMAIRRYEKESELSERLMERIEDVLTSSELTMKSDIIYYTFPRKNKFHRIATDAYKEIDKRSGERIYVLQSDAEIAIVINAKNSEIVEERIEESEAKNIERNLAMIIMDSPDKILEADGIISYLTEKIIFNGIGLIDLLTTYTETVFLVREEDSTNLYETLRNLTNLP